MNCWNTAKPSPAIRAPRSPGASRSRQLVDCSASMLSRMASISSSLAPGSTFAVTACASSQRPCMASHRGLWSSFSIPMASTTAGTTAVANIGRQPQPSSV